MVVGPERLTQAEHDAGDIVLERVANCETDRQTEHAGPTQHRAHQGRGPDEVKGQHDAHHHAGHPYGLCQQVPDKGVGGQPPPE